jgi:hypothetical protein
LEQFLLHQEKGELLVDVDGAASMKAVASSFAWAEPLRLAPLFAGID